MVERLLTHPSCNGSWDSSMNIANLATVANAGLTKFVVLPVSTIINASQPLTFACTMKQVCRWKGTTGLGPGGPVTVFMRIAYQNVWSVVLLSSTGCNAIIRGVAPFTSSSTGGRFRSLITLYLASTYGPSGIMFQSGWIYTVCSPPADMRALPSRRSSVRSPSTVWRSSNCDCSVHQLTRWSVAHMSCNGCPAKSTHAEVLVRAVCRSSVVSSGCSCVPFLGALSTWSVRLIRLCTQFVLCQIIAACRSPSRLHSNIHATDLSWSRGSLVASSHSCTRPTNTTPVSGMVCSRAIHPSSYALRALWLGNARAASKPRSSSSSDAMTCHWYKRHVRHSPWWVNPNCSSHSHRGFALVAGIVMFSIALITPQLQIPSSAATFTGASTCSCPCPGAGTSSTLQAFLNVLWQNVVKK